MKRTLIIALSGLAIIIVLSIYIEKYLKITSKELVNIIDEMENRVIAVEIEKSKQSLKKLNEEWDNVKDNWAMLVDHEELDNAEETMQYIKIFIDEMDRQADVLAEINKLRFYVEHIPERESFLLKNIF